VREQFWRFYWQKFVKFLLSQDAYQVLDLLSFWFEDISNLFEQAPYMLQDFFIGLPSTLEAAQKERGFRDAARQLQTAVAHQQRYLWFTLIQPLFAQQEKG
jgi:prephenate dehydrogenase